MNALLPTHGILKSGVVCRALHIVGTDILTDLLLWAFNVLNWIIQVMLTAAYTEKKIINLP